jgi:hypothetical protein
VSVGDPQSGLQITITWSFPTSGPPQPLQPAEICTLTSVIPTDLAD